MGGQIPFAKFGYNSLFDFQRDIPEIACGWDLFDEKKFLMGDSYDHDKNLKTILDYERKHSVR